MKNMCYFVYFKITIVGWTSFVLLSGQTSLSYIYTHTDLYKSMHCCVELNLLICITATLHYGVINERCIFFFIMVKTEKRGQRVGLCVGGLTSANTFDRNSSHSKKTIGSAFF